MNERQNGLELVREAITEHYGERCDEDEPGCPCCDVWAWFDAACARLEWQPIETAPKDGTRVILFERGRKICLGEYVSTHWALTPGGWKNTNGNFFDPTHWMPLPEPPK